MPYRNQVDEIEGKLDQLIEMYLHDRRLAVTNKALIDSKTGICQQVGSQVSTKDVADSQQQPAIVADGEAP